MPSQGGGAAAQPTAGQAGAVRGLKESRPVSGAAARRPAPRPAG
ncbi:hypothetical protein HMPREF0731_4619, partial [Pseudoroseomonas cervicalis ATCC 49957]